MKLLRTLILLAMPLALSSCFLAPGAFVSALDLRRDGSFTFSYKGEIVFLSPSDFDKGSAPKPWADTMAICPKDGAPYSSEYAENTVTATVAPPLSSNTDTMKDAENQPAEEVNRPCTKTELATLKKDYEQSARTKSERDKKEAEQFAAMFGFNPGDEAANAKLAANLMRYDGWKSVSYTGKGVFEVDYQIVSKTGHDFVFPMFAQGDVLIPFVTLRGQDKGSVRIKAPALIGGGMKALSAQMKMLGASDMKDAPQSSRTRGTFTVTTDGEILTNNTADGASNTTTGKQLVWQIDPQTETAPEALIKLR